MEQKVKYAINLISENGQVVVSSREVAEHFGKEHKHVLDAVKNLVAENSATKSMFYETTFENRGKQYPMYLMNRDGFSLLTFGFTGKEALEWKLKYIDAFQSDGAEAYQPGARIYRDAVEPRSDCRQQCYRHGAQEGKGSGSGKRQDEAGF